MRPATYPTAAPERPAPHHRDQRRRGLGTERLRRLLEIAQSEQVRLLTADILPDNLPMQRLCERLGFRLSHNMEEGVVTATLDLN